MTTLAMHNQTFGQYLQDLVIASRSPHSEAVNRFERSTPLGNSEQIPSDGGFLVEEQFVPTLIERMYEVGEILDRCTEISITNPRAHSLTFAQYDEQSRKNGSRLGGVEAYFQNEADALIASKPKFRLSKMTAEKLTALYWASDELTQDAPMLGAAVTKGFASEMAFVLENSILNGSGVGEPLGVLNSPVTLQVPKANNQAAGTILGTNILGCWDALWGPSRKTAVWLVNPQIETQLMQLTIPIGTGGSELPVYSFSSDPDQPYNSILGRPVIPCEYCQVAGTPGDVILADMSRYIVALKQVMQATLSIHVQFLTDQNVFKFVMRVNGQPLDHTPLAPLNGTGSVSPFAVIAQR